jgi:hypothetical protein
VPKKIYERSFQVSAKDSFVDRQRFDADPDPTFYFDADQYPAPGPDPTLKLGKDR